MWWWHSKQLSCSHLPPAAWKVKFAIFAPLLKINVFFPFTEESISQQRVVTSAETQPEKPRAKRKSATSYWVTQPVQPGCANAFVCHSKPATALKNLTFHASITSGSFIQYDGEVDEWAERKWDGMGDGGKETRKSQSPAWPPWLEGQSPLAFFCLMAHSLMQRNAQSVANTERKGRQWENNCWFTPAVRSPIFLLISLLQTQLSVRWLHAYSGRHLHAEQQPQPGWTCLYEELLIWANFVFPTSKNSDFLYTRSPFPTSNSDSSSRTELECQAIWDRCWVRLSVQLEARLSKLHWICSKIECQMLDSGLHCCMSKTSAAESGRAGGFISDATLVWVVG